MQADRDLLEAAARAASYNVRWCLNGVEGDERECFVFVKTGERWEPQDDDGDALRLAVKLGIDLSFEGDNVVFADGTCSEFLRDDYCAATRRAIVRAAAALAPQAPPQAQGQQQGEA